MIPSFPYSTQRSQQISLQMNGMETEMSGLMPADGGQGMQTSESQQLLEENQRLSEQLQKAKADSVAATPRSQGSFTTVHVPGRLLLKRHSKWIYPVFEYKHSRCHIQDTQSMHSGISVIPLKYRRLERPILIHCSIVSLCGSLGDGRHGDCILFWGMMCQGVTTCARYCYEGQAIFWNVLSLPDREPCLFSGSRDWRGNGPGSVDAGGGTARPKSEPHRGVEERARRGSP